MTDATLGARGLWLGTRTGVGGTATLTESFFWPQPMFPWTTGPVAFGFLSLDVPSPCTREPVSHGNFHSFFS